jgi:hypothetical protein
MVGAILTVPDFVIGLIREKVGACVIYGMGIGTCHCIEM